MAVSLFIRQGVDLNSLFNPYVYTGSSKRADSALEFAAANDTRRVARLLVEAGVRHGQPVYFSDANGNPKKNEYLVANGAQPVGMRVGATIGFVDVLDSPLRLGVCRICEGQGMVFLVYDYEESVS